MSCIFCADGKCCSSVCSHHLQKVSQKTCKKCLHYQDKPTISDKIQIQKLIEKALSLIEKTSGAVSLNFPEQHTQYCVVLSAVDHQTAINMLKIALKVSTEGVL